MSSALPGYLARRIEVFDAHQPVAAGMTRVEIAGSRRDERPEVQRPGRERARSGRSSSRSRSAPPA